MTTHREDSEYLILLDNLKKPSRSFGRYFHLITVKIKPVSFCTFCAIPLKKTVTPTIVPSQITLGLGQRSNLLVEQLLGLNPHPRGLAVLEGQQARKQVVRESLRRLAGKKSGQVIDRDNGKGRSTPVVLVSGDSIGGVALGTYSTGTGTVGSVKVVLIE